MKRVCMLLLCLTLCLGPVQSLGQGTDAGYLQGYLTDLSQGENLDALYACLDATMQAALSREDFASLWGQLAAISGEFLGFDGDTESTAMGEYLVLTQRLDMSGMDLLCTMSLDASGKVAGLQFIPAPATADETAPSAGVTEEAIQVGEAPWELPGLLTLPENAQGPLPAVVLVQGSGPSDRNESVGAVKPFYDLAQALAAQGIAVVRYDTGKKSRPPRRIPPLPWRRRRSRMRLRRGNCWQAIHALTRIAFICWGTAWAPCWPHVLSRRAANCLPG